MANKEKEHLLHNEDSDVKEQIGLTSGSKLKETMIIVAIIFINTLALCVDTMPMPFFNYEAKKRGLVEYQSGIVMGCYDFGRLLAGPLCPLIISKLSVKRSMIAAASICGISSVIFGFITYLRQPELLFALLTIMRTVSGAAAMLLVVSCTSLLMQSKTYSNATMFSCVELASGLGYGVGGLIGAGLIKLVGFEFSFIVIGGIVCLSALPCIYFVPNIIDVTVGQRKKGLTQFIKLPGTVIFLMVFVAANYGTMGIYNMAGAWVVETFGVPISTWNLYYVGAPLMYVVGSIVGTAITNRVTVLGYFENKALEKGVNTNTADLEGYVYSTVFASAAGYILCFLFMCPSPLLDPLFNNKHFLPMTVILFGLHSFFEQHLQVPLYQALVNLALANGHDADSVNTYAVVTSAVNFSWAIGSMLGSPLTGITTQYIGLPWATTIIALIDAIVITILGLFLVIMKILRKPLS